jgi:hypothetical protein
MLVGVYTLWAALEGKVYAKPMGLRQIELVTKEDRPGYFWVVITIYAGLSVALLTVF